MLRHSSTFEKGLSRPVLIPVLGFSLDRPTTTVESRGVGRAVPCIWRVPFVESTHPFPLLDGRGGRRMINLDEGIGPSFLGVFPQNTLSVLIVMVGVD